MAHLRLNSLVKEKQLYHAPKVDISLGEGTAGRIYRVNESLGPYVTNKRKLVLSERNGISGNFSADSLDSFSLSLGRGYLPKGIGSRRKIAAGNDKVRVSAEVREQHDTPRNFTGKVHVELPNIWEPRSDISVASSTPRLLFRSETNIIFPPSRRSSPWQLENKLKGRGRTLLNIYHPTLTTVLQTKQYLPTYCRKMPMSVPDLPTSR